MAKIVAPAPKAPVAPEVEVTAPDLALLTQTLAPLFVTSLEIEKQGKQNNLAIAVAVREFRAENTNLERNDAKLAIQMAVSEAWGLKLADVQNHSAAIDKDTKKPLKGYSAYTLVSAILGIAWPKGEAEDKKVQKALEQGKGWVEVRKAASKPQKTPTIGENSRRITDENFPTKLNTFLSQAQVDIGESIEDIYTRAESAISAMRNAPPA